MSEPFPRPLVLGHRGAPFQALENTLRSFALALEAGADGVELDVQRAAGGTPVVIHDATLERTGQGEGAVTERTPEELSRAEPPVPSLEEAARWAAGAGAWLNVEIKAREVEEATLAALSRAGVLERTFLSSFHPEMMERLRDLAPDALRFLLSERWDEAAREAAARAGVRGVCLRDDAATPPALDALRREGYAAVVWTVDDPGRLRSLLAAGAAAVITNRPELR